MINPPTAAVPDPRHLRLHLLDTKFFDFRIKYELLARDQRNLQETSVTLNFFPRNALDQGMTFEQGGPDCVKIISPAYQLSALPRQIAGSFLRHFRHPFDTKFKNRLPNLLLDPDQFRYCSLAVEPTSRRFARLLIALPCRARARRASATSTPFDHRVTFHVLSNADADCACAVSPACSR
jgi:hypothetical protein